MKFRTTLAAVLSLALLVACLPLAGCQQFQQAMGIQPAATQPSAQAQLDGLRERYGQALAVLTPLVEHNVISDPDALKAIRVAIKEADGFIRDAQVQLDAHQPITAQFIVDKAAAAVTALEREKDKHK